MIRPCRGIFKNLTTRRAVVGLVIVAIQIACSSKILKSDRSEEILRNEDFEKAVVVREVPAPTPALNSAPSPATSGTPSTALIVAFESPAPSASPVPQATPMAEVTPSPTPTPDKKSRNGKHTKSAGVVIENKTVAPSATPHREPALEDAEGFNGRRPIADPFRAGEKTVFEVSYFSVVAGDMTVEVQPFVEVNGRLSYRFSGTAKSTSVFAMFYAVDDRYESFVDYATMVPFSYSLHVKESNQLRETRTLFNWDQSRAYFWDKKINPDETVEEKKADWQIPAYSQNVFTAVYYLRTFTLRPGKKINFRVAHENENLVVSAEVIRREVLSTPAGDFNTIVVKPKIELDGVFKAVGDIFLWLTDDDRKILVRLESKIKIGKIVAVAKQVEYGN